MRGVSETKDKSEGGFFSRLKSRLNRGRAWLSNDLKDLVTGKVDEATLEELEDRLLMADVGVEATEQLVSELRSRLPRVATGETVGSTLAKIIEELLAPVAQPLPDSFVEKPFVILTVGVNGTGKTTTIGKLAARYTGLGHEVVLAAGDTFRAAAREQIEVWAKRSGATLVAQHPGADPAAVVHDALTSARAKDADLLIADTAGRLQNQAGLMDELAKIKRVLEKIDATTPHEVLLVLDASQGQNALRQAEEFHSKVGVTGLVITKLDGSAKGGIVLAIAKRLGLPIRFIGVGEAAEDLQPFTASEFTQALLYGNG